MSEFVKFVKLSLFIQTVCYFTISFPSKLTPVLSSIKNDFESKTKDLNPPIILNSLDDSMLFRVYLNVRGDIGI